MKKLLIPLSFFVALFFAALQVNGQKVLSYTGHNFTSVDLSTCTTTTADSSIGSMGYYSGNSTFDHVHHRYFFMGSSGGGSAAVINGYDLDSNKDITINTGIRDLGEIEYCDSNNTIYGLNHHSFVWINLSTLAVDSVSMPFTYSGYMAGGSTFDQVHGIYYDVFDSLRGINVNTHHAINCPGSTGAEWEYCNSDGKFYGVTDLAYPKSLSFICYDPAHDTVVVIKDSLAMTNGYAAGASTFDQSTNRYILFGDALESISTSGILTTCSSGGISMAIPEVTGPSSTTSSGIVLEGKVHTSTGDALKNQWVYLLVYNASDSTISAVDSIKTDTIGHYRFATTDSLVYIVASPDSADYPNELETYYDSVVDVQNATQLHLLAGSNHLNFNTIGGTNHSGGGFIGGKITICYCKKAGQGQPVANLRVLLIDDNGKVVKATKTNAGGNFGFPHLAMGKYKIWVDYPKIDNSLAPEIVITNLDTGTSYRFENFWLTPTSLEFALTSIAPKQALASNLDIYPNPFATSATIEYTLNKASYSALTLYDLSGHEIQKLEESNKPAGKYSFSLDAANNILPSGMYIVKLMTTDQTTQIMMIKQ